MLGHIAFRCLIYFSLVDIVFPAKHLTRLSKKPVCNGLAGDRARIFRLERDGQAEGGLEGLGQRPEGVDLADIVNECE